jgi:hypothetical protein
MGDAFAARHRLLNGLQEATSRPTLPSALAEDRSASPLVAQTWLDLEAIVSLDDQNAQVQNWSFWTFRRSAMPATHAGSEGWTQPGGRPAGATGHAVRPVSSGMPVAEFDSDLRAPQQAADLAADLLVVGGQHLQNVVAVRPAHLPQQHCDPVRGYHADPVIGRDLGTEELADPGSSIVTADPQDPVLFQMSRLGIGP